MAESYNRETYNYGESGNFSGSGWPGTEQSSEPRYQPPSGYGYSNNFSPPPWTASSIPASLVARAEQRVKAQRRFFKQLFIYMGVVAAFWLIGISILATESSHRDPVAIFLPLFVTVVWGVKVAWNYFDAFIWNKKTHAERVEAELQSLLK